MYNFSDDGCHSLSVPSSWKYRGRSVDVSCQTSVENEFETADSTVQTGKATVSVEKEVKQKDDTASLLAYCKGRIKKYDEETWLHLLEKGSVVVGEEIVVILHYFIS